jgi:hypothetical protein
MLKNGFGSSGPPSVSCCPRTSIQRQLRSSRMSRPSSLSPTRESSPFRSSPTMTVRPHAVVRSLPLDAACVTMGPLTAPALCRMETRRRCGAGSSRGTAGAFSRSRRRSGVLAGAMGRTWARRWQQRWPPGSGGCCPGTWRPSTTRPGARRLLRWYPVTMALTALLPTEAYFNNMIWATARGCIRASAVVPADDRICRTTDF